MCQLINLMEIYVVMNTLFNYHVPIYFLQV